jgi:hypothetical protein
MTNMKYFNGTLTAERPNTPWVREEKSDCTDCYECRCTEMDYCHECSEPLCEECAHVIDDMPMCTECCQTYVTERLQRIAFRRSMMQMHDATVAMLEEVA